MHAGYLENILLYLATTCSQKQNCNSLSLLTVFFRMVEGAKLESVSIPFLPFHLLVYVGGGEKQTLGHVQSTLGNSLLVINRSSRMFASFLLNCLPL